LTPSVDPLQTLARGPSPSAEEYPVPFGSDPYLPNVLTYKLNKQNK